MSNEKEKNNIDSNCGQKNCEGTSAGCPRITGLMMAWGMFCTIPVPSKRWDEGARQWMLFFFPIVGLVVGGFWALVMFLIDALAPAQVIASNAKLLFAAALVIAPFLISGFMHLDGFMDCCDAVLSRRDLEGRQKILKDSHTGSFAIVCFVFLMMVEFASFAAMDFSNWQMLIVIPVVSRCISALAVTLCKPMCTSQYAALGNRESEAGTSNKESKNSGRTASIIFAIALLVAAGVISAIISWSALIVVLVEAFASIIIILINKKSLGGMNGDISGCALVFSEAAAVLMMSILL